MGWVGTPASDWLTRGASIVARRIETKKNSGMDVAIFRGAYYFPPRRQQ